MTNEPISDEDLMRYADGTLAPDERARIAARLAQEPDLAARVAAFGATTARLADLARASAAPVPEALEAKIRAMAAQQPAGSAPAPTAAQTITPPTPANSSAAPWALPLAACLFMGLGALGTFAALKRPSLPTSPLAALSQPEVQTALGTLASGQSRALAGGATLAAVASFTDSSGALCREVEYHPTPAQRVLSVLCHQGDTGKTGGWDMRLAIASGAGAGYVPASSMETLDAYLLAQGASAPLDLAAEAAALAALK